MIKDRPVTREGVRGAFATPPQAPKVRLSFTPTLPKITFGSKIKKKPANELRDVS